MKKILCFLLIVTGGLSAIHVHAQDENIEGGLMAAYQSLSESEINDVIELLRFVRTAKPELFEKFAASFEEVGVSCGKSALDENQADELADLIEYIEKELPKTNKDLLGKIKLALMFGGKKYYNPKFADKDKVRENISKFMLAVHQSYASKEFGACTQLISRAQESRVQALRFAAAAKP